MELSRLEDIDGFDAISNFSPSFVEGLSEAITSDNRDEEILDLLDIQIEVEFDYLYDYYIEGYFSDGILEAPDLLDEAIFLEEYHSRLKEVYDEVKAQINLGLLFLERNPGNGLEWKLDQTFGEYQEQEKVHKLFEQFKESSARIAAPSTRSGVVLEDNDSKTSATETRNTDKDIIAVSAGGQRNPIPSDSGIGTRVRGGGSTTEIDSLDCNYHERDGQREKRVKFRRIWNHSTISRDETSANAFKLLYAILSPHIVSQGDQRHDHDRFSSVTGTEVLLEYQQSHTTQTGVSNPQLGEIPRQGTLSDRQDWNTLNAQKVRLQQTRQKLLSNTFQQTSTLNDKITGASVPVINMARKDQESEAPTGQGDQNGNQVIDHDARGIDLDDSEAGHQNLKHRIASLERENKRLRTSQAVTPRCQVLYFVNNRASGPQPPGKAPPSTAYTDKPTWSVGPNGEIVLTAHFPIPDVSGFLRQSPDIAFVVCYYYSHTSQDNEVQNAARAKRMLPQPKPTSEMLRLHSLDMIEAVESFLALQPKFSNEFPSLNIRGPLHAPYLFWYHYRSATALDVLSPTHKNTMQLLTEWIEEHYAEKFDHVDDQLKRGVISEDTMPFLVKPGNVLVWKEQHEINAAVAKSWAYRKSPMTVVQERIGKEQDWTGDGSAFEKRKTTWTVDSWKFNYDGRFYRKELPVNIDLSTYQPQDELQIKELKIHPLEYAESHFKDALENRGTLFWKCRHQHLVSYESLPREDQRNEQNNGERFMVDFETYRQLHSSSSTFKMSYPSIDDDKCQRMNPETMASDEPPSAPDIYVFPNTIPGYNLRSKKWVDLNVDMIRNVTWNKKSFDHLVVDDETKELVQALVKHQIASQKSTDIIDRKGNGLIILLHGGPGTGKTFTAESVAEMAEKPLFRITCGDIGTEPEKVENYLDSVLHLGKIWDCIVLIDEAEVFLEQRNLNNLERNALVSVFLRVLEYYEGILILTSNRVGTFDEAFKSRILLSLHYENLTEGQRTKIWKNFFKRLKEMGEENDRNESSLSLSSLTEPGSRKRKFQDETQDGTEGVDFDDVECYITELAKHELNGRQIRNVITTARQLAVSRNELMRYKHLEHVIKVSSKFDKYLKTVREGFSDDQVARDEGIR
ncbi:hypothetical protein PFICI_02877 [Pestalotiopsis fici W106-1]|uniref:AAA+ ATPase domain-containing protein n=1 Tax=Pestalotiopsis fici (strain W106-1 / CGMCC3.15140) TaxID=1229662 RepID=W3XHE8_PESFW|nr:uncharacterized protein PFICI_02877 [Pestalotiopsis fici W106-1]ETS84852.1 hypothetical protein PFICI_02877 [Pestalotiopsis fici W106-1]